MTLVLNFKPEVEAALFAQAQANGLSLEDYVHSVVERSAVFEASSTLSSEERACLFDEWGAGANMAPPLSEYAVSRDAMYEHEMPY